MGSIIVAISNKCKKLKFITSTLNHQQLNAHLLPSRQINNINNLSNTRHPSRVSGLSTVDNDHISRNSKRFIETSSTPHAEGSEFFSLTIDKLDKLDKLAMFKNKTLEKSLSTKDIFKLAVPNSNSNSNNLTRKDFEIIKLLGKGTFGKVFLVRNLRNKKLYAMKVLIKDMIQKARQVAHTKNEREILEKIDHPFIVKLFFAFQDEEKLYLVTEFMQGGELFFHLKKSGVFSERKTRMYVCEVILAIEHLHKHKIIYRDLKPENILLDENGHIKLTDFGLSKIFSDEFNSNPNNILVNNQKAFTFCGTAEYLAPEVLLGQGYTKSIDWWSLGMLMYEMLIGTSFFVKRRRCRLDIETFLKPIEITPEDNISDTAKDLILQLLAINPKMRLSESNDIKSHPFFKDVNWDDIYIKKIVPEYIPKNVIKSEDDVICFDSKMTQDRKDSEIMGETSQKKKMDTPPISESQPKVFGTKPKTGQVLSTFSNAKNFWRQNNLKNSISPKKNTISSDRSQELNKEFERFSYTRHDEIGV